MKKQGIGKLLAVIGVVGLLAGCSSSTPYGTGEGWGNFKCTAMSQSGRASVGWAAVQSRASSIAMDKCRARAANPGSCRIAQCVSQ